MKLLALICVPALFACGTTRNLSLDSKTAPIGPKAACADECDVTARCTPDGRCILTCVCPDGSTCEIELDCQGGQCEVVRCDGPSACCPGTGASKPKE